MSRSPEDKSKLRQQAVNLMKIYGIDGNNVMQDGIDREGYYEFASDSSQQDGRAVLFWRENDRLAQVRKSWPKEFPIDMFMELYDAIVR